MLGVGAGEGIRSLDPNLGKVKYICNNHWISLTFFHFRFSIVLRMCEFETSAYRKTMLSDCQSPDSLLLFKFAPDFNKKSGKMMAPEMNSILIRSFLSALVMANKILTD